MVKKFVAILLTFILMMTACSCGASDTAGGGQNSENNAAGNNAVTEEESSETETKEEPEAETAETGQSQEQNTENEQNADKEQNVEKEQETGTETTADGAEASQEEQPEDSDEYDELAAIGDVQVENGTLTVSVTLPAELAEGATQEQLDENKGTTYQSAVLNEDGSVTYKMTKEQHTAMMEQLSETLEEGLQEMIDDNETFSIAGITHNEDFSVFDVTMDGKELGFGDSFSVMAFNMYGGMYGIFSGNRIENVVVNFLDPDGNLIKKFNSAETDGAEESLEDAASSENSESGDDSAKAVTFERTVLVDNEECSIVVKEIKEKGEWGYTLKTELENKSSDKKYIFSVESAYVNGVEADPFFVTEVSAGKKANKDISFDDSALKEYGVDDFTDIEISFRVYDDDDYANVVAEETVHIYPYGEENATKFSRETADTDTVLADDDNVTIIVTGYTEKDDLGYYKVNLYLENKTDKYLMFSVDDASVNGYMADPLFATDLNAGKCAFTSMYWSDTTFEENEIEKVEEIVVHFNVYDYDDYDTTYLDEEYTLNP